MIVYRILLTRGGEHPLEFMISGVPLIVGRSTRADIALTEDSISRRHARFFVLNNTLYIEDLESSNGVHINGRRVHKAALSGEDNVQIGAYSIRVERLDDAGQRRLVRRTEIEHAEVAPIHEKLVVSDQTAVAFLYRVTQCVCQNRQARPMLEHVLDTVMAAIPADRGIILARRSTEETPVAAASRVRDGRTADTPVSQTLVGHVLSTRTSVMTEDAAHDERFEASESIAAHQIKAVICVPLTGRDGVYGVIYAEANAVPAPLTHHHLQLLSVAGQIAGAGVENIILTERQIRQERLAGIGETVSGTGHDMRNIMMGISGGAGLIELACNQNNIEQVRLGVAVIRKSLDRFDRLVDSLLRYARQADLVLQETKLAELAAEAVNAASAAAMKKGVRLNIEDHAAGAVLIDPDQAYRVMLNLITNALDATADGGTISIESGRRDGTVYMSVRDSGSGIEPEHLAKLGQPFFTTKGESGTGLGLALCFRIMEQHHGRIAIESSPGRGSTFTLHFPVDQSATRHDGIPA